MKVIKIVLFVLLSISFFQCQNSEIESKIHPNDPFKKSIIKSEYFEINTKTDHVIEGKNGTVVVIPKACFLDANNNIIEDDVTIELAEALSLDDMILSNLTTTSNGKLLETDGMIYFNAFANGKPLTIDKENPIYIEIPSQNKKPNMMAYKGIRDENGNMNWIEPKELEKFLIPIDFDLLDFYPEGFENEVIKGLPFKNHEITTKALTDSLYYSLAIYSETASEEIRDSSFISTNLNEAHYNNNKKVVNNRYTDASYEIHNEDGHDYAHDGYTEVRKNCIGINPAIIKTIRTKSFENSLIATREFEIRLQSIFESCSDDIIKIYINNSSKNLWELDNLASIYLADLGKDSLSQIFSDFSKEKLTNVENANQYSELLKAHYQKKLKEITAELQALHNKALQQIQKNNDAAKQLAKEYKSLLFEREKHRMETYGFEWTDTGWINIDKEVPNITDPEIIDNKKYELLIMNSKKYEQIYSYIIYSSIKSIYRLNTTDNELFYIGDKESDVSIMSRNNTAALFSIAYTGEKIFLAVKEFNTSSNSNHTLDLKLTNQQKIKEVLQPYEGYKTENKIEKDLEYMALFQKEKKRQEGLKAENSFMLKLWEKANPCCDTSIITISEGGN